MAKPIIAHPVQESTSKEKTASCSGCAQMFSRRELREVGPEEVSWSFTIRKAKHSVGLALLIKGCFDAQLPDPRCPLEANLARLL
jgi:hypothetical protein